MLIDLTLKIDPAKGTSAIAKLGHYGTHLDIMDKEIPIENFITKGKLIDITQIRNRLIEKTDIPQDINIDKKDFVIFRSNWLKDQGYATPDYFSEHPHLSDDTIDFLLAKQISFIGLDFPGAQRKEKHLLIDNKCASQDVYIIENLDNLHLVTKNEFKVYCFPMHLTGSTGIPIRIVADLE